AALTDRRAALLDGVEEAGAVEERGLDPRQERVEVGKVVHQPGQPVAELGQGTLDDRLDDRAIAGLPDPEHDAVAGDDAFHGADLRGTSATLPAVVEVVTHPDAKAVIDPLVRAFWTYPETVHLLPDE